MQSELHRHLDVSIRPETLFVLAQKKGLIPEAVDFHSFLEKLIIRQPMRDLETVLAQFSIFQRVLTEPEALVQLGFEAVEDCWKEGTRLVEFRYAPNFISEFSHLSWKDSLNALQSGIQLGLKRYPEMKAGLICIAVRDYGQEEVDRTIDFFLNHQDSFIGVDLAGNEAEFPARLFENSFKKAIQKKANITIHAGEASGPESIWEAIELLGAKRIGHGIRCVEDPQLMSYLADQEICLEVCPTSNWLTQATPSWEQHPLAQIVRSGIPACINTDDPGIFGVTLTGEMEICRTKLGITTQELKTCLDAATQASFISTESGKI